MSGIVVELQREALDKTVRISDLLRKALLVARKLKVADIESWVLGELNGYSDNASVPEYRWVTGEIKAWNSYNGMWLPIMFPESDAKKHRALTKRLCGQAIAEIESLISKTSDGNLAMPYPPEIQARLIKAAELPSPPILLISEAKLHGILDAVRTTILEWSLRLEEQGIFGANLSFSEADCKAASHIVFNIGSMSHSQIQAETAHSQQVIADGAFDTKRVLEFVQKARESLPGLGLPNPAADELAGELATLEAQAKSPKPKGNIVKESLRSARTILEGATGNVAAEALLHTLKLLFG